MATSCEGEGFEKKNFRSHVSCFWCCRVDLQRVNQTIKRRRREHQATILESLRGEKSDLLSWR